jgi:hypothetical protein
MYSVSKVNHNDDQDVKNLESGTSDEVSNMSVIKSHRAKSLHSLENHDRVDLVLSNSHLTLELFTDDESHEGRILMPLLVTPAVKEEKFFIKIRMGVRKKGQLCIQDEMRRDR